MATVTNTVKLPDGSTPDRVDVVIELVASTTGKAAGWITATDVTLEATVRPTVTNGAWTASLTPNADITPSGSVYKVTEYVDKSRYIHYITVGSGGGSLFDLLADAPASVASAALTSHIADTTGAHAASAVSVTDTGALYSSTEVEAALAEVAATNLPLQSALTLTAGAVTVPATAGRSATVALSADATITLASPSVAYRTLDLVLVQDATGGRAVTWATSVGWVDDTEPEVVQPPAARTIVKLVWDGSAWSERSRNADPIRTAWDKLAPTVTTSAFLHRLSSTSYRVGYKLADDLWWAVTLSPGDAAPGGHTLYQITNSEFFESFTQTDADTTGQTGTWVNGVVNASAFGGTYNYTAVTNSTVTWTSGAAGTALAVNIVKATNGGYALVTIDGSTTAANLLPTAQEEVDAGRLASTVLVANGGTLNPTDRVLECYGSPLDATEWVRIASGLSSATHTVVLTNVGYKRAAATGTRVYLSGWAYGPATSPTPLNLLGVQMLHPTVHSVWEYAYSLDAGSGAEFVGNGHGYERQDSLTFKVDGSTVTLSSVDDYHQGTVVEAIRASTLFHPDVAAGATAIGTVALRYRASDQLQIWHEDTWSQSLTATLAYAAMMPCAPAYSDRCRVHGDITRSLTADDDSHVGAAHTRLVRLWDDGGSTVFAFRMETLDGVNDWAASPLPDGGLWVQDRADGYNNKVYATRVWTSETTSGVWRSYVSHRMAFDPDLVTGIAAYAW